MTEPIRPPCRLRITCEVHGLLSDEAVFCQHDIEADVRKVTDAHRPAYGANCRAVVNIELVP